MFTYATVKDRPALLRVLTSLTPAEFAQLLIPFQAVWDESVRQPPSDGTARQRAYGGGRKPVLERIDDKLFFILYYFKTYPLQAVLALQFEMSQAQACAWIHTLSPLLKAALGRLHHLPDRLPAQTPTPVASDGEPDFVIDGTERRRQRPKDAEKQQRYYSGKKKTHTVKNIVIITRQDRKVRALGQTAEGKKHDKKLADEDNVTLPDGSVLYQDTGFQGYAPAGATIRQPKKKPQGKELTAEDKAENTLISRLRIVIEHVLAGIKRCRIVKDVFRNTKADFDDLVMEIACALHNFRTACRSTPKASQPANA